jgi:hypothetical protein
MRRSHFIKANHHTKLPLRMIWVDTEALNQDGQVAPGRQTLTFGVAVYERYADGQTDTVVSSDRLEFTDPYIFWEWVESKIDPKTCVWVMAHNWNYDAGILDTSNILPALGFTLAKYVNGKPPLIVSWKKNGHNIRMVDTLNYFAGSVASLGQSVGLPKLDMPADDAPDAEWKVYAWRDVEIIRLAFLGFRSFVREQDLGVMQSTLASQSFSAFRHRFMRHQIAAHDNEEALLLERRAFHGGRTESFWRGHAHGPLYKLDINSMYPAIMAKEKLGYSFETYFPIFVKSWWEKARRTDRAIVAEVEIQTDEPVYGIVYEGKLVFPVGTFWTTLTTPEIDYAAEHGHIKRIGAFAIHKRDVLFKDFVDHFYGLRLEYRTAGNATYDYMAKILMNSCYGKWGQNGRKWIETDEYDWPDTWDYGHEGYIEKPDGELVKLRWRLGRVQMLLTDGESENSVPMIAAEITAYGRVQLWKLAKKAGIENVYYADTDSLVVNETGYHALRAEIDPTLLGAVKLEATLEYGRFIAPKDYSTWAGIPWAIEEKIKGVRAKAIRLGDNNYRQDVFSSWDANLKHQHDGGIIVTSTVKHLNRRNTKRIVRGEDMATDPIEINEELLAARWLAAQELFEAEELLAGYPPIRLFRRLTLAHIKAARLVVKHAKNTYTTLDNQIKSLAKTK